MTQFILLSLFLSINIAQASSYEAEVREIGAPDKILYRILGSESNNKDALLVQAKAYSGDDIVMEENASLNPTNFETLNYTIINNQTGETAKLVLEKGQYRIEYKEKNKPEQKKDLGKIENLVTPANFEDWIRGHFEQLKKEKSISVSFLVWERHETLNFKISYLGENQLNGETTHLFKMNINNFLVAAFIDPIKIWFNADMKQMRRYLGRIALKKKEKDGKYSNLDGDVLYTYKN
jgi:hypothetical protein